jgi:hypothetical protein
MTSLVVRQFTGKTLVLSLQFRSRRKLQAVASRLAMSLTVLYTTTQGNPTRLL